MKKSPKVLTRMRLSCCWGDNLNEKELNEVVHYIDELEQQIEKQQEVIDKMKRLKQFYIKDFEERNITMIPLSNLTKNIDIVLKEVSE